MAVPVSSSRVRKHMPFAVPGRWRVLLNTSALLEVQGLLEHREGVTHVRALRLRRLQAPDRMPVGHNYA